MFGLIPSEHRSALKKWLAVEKQLGDEDSIEVVKTRAQAWKMSNGART